MEATENTTTIVVNNDNKTKFKYIKTSMSLMYYLDANSFKLLTYIINTTNLTGNLNFKVSFAKMSYKLDLDAKTIQKCINNLESENILSINSGFSNRECNVYTLSIETMLSLDEYSVDELIEMKKNKKVTKVKSIKKENIEVKPIVIIKQTEVTKPVEVVETIIEAEEITIDNELIDSFIEFVKPLDIEEIKSLQRKYNKQECLVLSDNWSYIKTKITDFDKLVKINQMISIIKNKTN